MYPVLVYPISAPPYYGVVPIMTTSANSRSPEAIIRGYGDHQCVVTGVLLAIWSWSSDLPGGGAVDFGDVAWWSWGHQICKGQKVSEQTQWV